ncbi:MAG: archaellin/type IV pilin N-terminal domain-containing protein [Candidatus Woesearchaeota archaeon]
MMRSNSKRGIMGIGTLIIFIATILVAAVAAAVLISTSNVLQQRSLLVGQEARKSITDGVDVFSIMAASNYSSETFNNYEVLMRLSSGSDPLQMRNFDVEMLSSKVHTAAELLYPEDGNKANVSTAVDDTWQTVPHDLDGDGENEQVRIIDSTNDSLVVNLSDAGLSDNIPLGDVSNGDRIELEETAITIGEEIYGTVEIDTTASGEAELPAGSVLFRKVGSECKFEFLPPEDYFCFQVVVGNEDYVMDSREKIKVLFKTHEENALTVGEDIMFIFASEKGRLTEARARTPDVIVYKSTRIWPLG